MEAGLGRRNHLALALCVAAAALVASLGAAAAGDASVTRELRRGFEAAHDPSYSQFQPVLADPTGAFAFGFLRVNSSMLDLAVLHLPSSFPLWRAIPDRPASWSAAATLSFTENGGLVLTDRAANKVLWSTAASGDRAVLLNTSNLQVQSGGDSGSVAWQSFNWPSETIVQGQNFTSAAALYTFDRRFAMRLATNYFALYIEPASPGVAAAAMYWKHTALEAKAQIVADGGPTYVRVEPDGFLAMYQKEGPPADVLSFDTFNRGVRSLRRMTLEPDGNLRAYYWNGARWTLDYTAITEPCELPTTCGAYGVCAPPSGRCECLTDSSGACAAGGGNSGLCGGGEAYEAVRRQGVEPANKELLGFEHAASVADCEARCERNCSCWGAVYSNGTGYCYLMDYPAQMLVASDDRKLGYFKVVRRMEGHGASSSRTKTALLGVGVAAVVAAAAFGAYRVWERRRRTVAELGTAADDGLSPGPYKNLGSFSSVELTNSFRR